MSRVTEINVLGLMNSKKQTRANNDGERPASVQESSRRMEPPATGLAKPRDQAQEEFHLTAAHKNLSTTFLLEQSKNAFSANATLENIRLPSIQ